MSDIKKIFFISPNFPPVNSADMHRVRQLIINCDYNEFNIDVLCLKPESSDPYSIDNDLLSAIPNNYRLFYTGAIPLYLSRMFGVGSISIRSFLHFFIKGNHLIRENKYDIIFFSTTATHLMYLGSIWKRKFNIPFVLDIQDPWANNYYLKKPSSERPPKYLINYKIDKYLESKTIPFADGIISVSKKYIEDFVDKYKLPKKTILETIPFGVEINDFNIDLSHINSSFLRKKKYSILYVGRGGYDLLESITLLLTAMKKGLSTYPEIFNDLHIYFVGTSYALLDKGRQTIMPLAIQMGLNETVTEITNRCSYFETIKYLQSADILFIPGSNDDRYTPSKFYTYLLCERPIIAITNINSDINELAKQVDFLSLFHFNENINHDHNEDDILQTIIHILKNSHQQHFIPQNIVNTFSAKSMSSRVFKIFEKILK